MERSGMAVVTMRQLLEAGVHFGHQTRRWNPKMKRFIFGERNGIYIIDLNQTLQRVDVAYSFVRDLVANGGGVLFIGTKKQSQDPIARSAQLCGMPYVNERWLGGMLTNFSTIALRVKKMQEYERMRSAGDFEAMPKKEALILTRELEKLERNLGGIRDMARLPDAVFIIDIKKEHIAVSEANKMGIPIVAVVDTNCDPDLVQYPIPGNDDAIRSGTLMCRVIQEAVQEGQFVASRRGTGGPAAGGPPIYAFEPGSGFEPAPAQVSPPAPVATASGPPAPGAHSAPAQPAAVQSGGGQPGEVQRGGAQYAPAPVPSVPPATAAPATAAPPTAAPATAGASNAPPGAEPVPPATAAPRPEPSVQAPPQHQAAAQSIATEAAAPRVGPAQEDPAQEDPNTDTTAPGEAAPAGADRDAPAGTDAAAGVGATPEH
jgi:small subunit ribosomal protein S2